MIYLICDLKDELLLMSVPLLVPYHHIIYFFFYCLIFLSCNSGNLSVNLIPFCLFDSCFHRNISSIKQILLETYEMTLKR